MVFANSTAASDCSGFAVFCSKATAVPPAATICSTTPCAASSLMSVTTTDAPSAAREREIAAPMPLPPPVTSAVLSLNRAMVCASLRSRADRRGRSGSSTSPSATVRPQGPSGNRCRFALGEIRAVRAAGLVRGQGGGMTSPTSSSPSTAVLFDIDGTLVDSNFAHVDAWSRAFTDVGHPVDSWRHPPVDRQGLGPAGRRAGREGRRRAPPRRREGRRTRGTTPSTSATRATCTSSSGRPTCSPSSPAGATASCSPRVRPRTS